MTFFTKSLDDDIKPFIPNKKINDITKQLKHQPDHKLYVKLYNLKVKEIIRLTNYHYDLKNCMKNNDQTIIKLNNKLKQNKLELELNGYQKINVIKTLYLEECINNKIKNLHDTNNKLLILRDHEFNYYNLLTLQIQEYELYYLNNLNYII